MVLNQRHEKEQKKAKRKMASSQRVRITLALLMQLISFNRVEMVSSENMVNCPLCGEDGNVPVDLRNKILSLEGSVVTCGTLEEALQFSVIPQDLCALDVQRVRYSCCSDYVSSTNNICSLCEKDHDSVYNPLLHLGEDTTCGDFEKYVESNYYPFVDEDHCMAIQATAGAACGCPSPPTRLPQCDENICPDEDQRIQWRRPLTFAGKRTICAEAIYMMGTDRDLCNSEKQIISKLCCVQRPDRIYNTEVGRLGDTGTSSSSMDFQDPSNSTNTTAPTTPRSTTSNPNRTPTSAPHRSQTGSPTRLPTLHPSDAPTLRRTNTTLTPSKDISPTFPPSRKNNTSTPSNEPSSIQIFPTLDPSSSPSNRPSTFPTFTQSASVQPSKTPTKITPTSSFDNPSMKPSHMPTKALSDYPTDEPSKTKTDLPTIHPSKTSTTQTSPTLQPVVSTPITQYPSLSPTISPTPSPTMNSITMTPSQHPTEQPSQIPSQIPTMSPSQPPIRIIPRAKSQKSNKFNKLNETNKSNKTNKNKSGKESTDMQVPKSSKKAKDRKSYQYTSE